MTIQGSKRRVNMSQETKTRRGIVLYKENPFISSTVVKAKTKRITNKRGDMMVVGDSGEIVAGVAGFWQAQEVDASKFVKLYVGGVKQIKELTGAGTRVFELLYLEVQKYIGQDRIFMSYASIDHETAPMSPATYKRGIAELIAKGFLAPTEVQGWYWLNPEFMWNGDRLAFVREFYKKGAKRVDPRQQALPLEEPQGQLSS